MTFNLFDPPNCKSWIKPCNHSTEDYLEPHISALIDFICFRGVGEGGEGVGKGRGGVGEGGVGVGEGRRGGGEGVG